ncbi:hypothetical protein BJF93_20795 [Xaviernesmea oryzae]|uniref:Inosine/uridine-preferring nucleoside hydrolase domain-containing protein n=1 Tax=Xaviernesmea oryzae TaxID=464029 RepID=A0A1Q9AZT0_9HYPH|nr:nucleoside hydrolase [Xaviernesmea oryzae]OLP61232.1 hypothetical protein BJF93_20795 [Xaviernesmea oryzae]SEL51251.1 purine nucleosidase [Xaviernesmea oryzae]
MAEPCRIILDVDTGIDDAMAIFYAVRHPNIRLEALTTVYGNTEVEIATDNTLKILDLLGRTDIPVAKGVGRSLLKPFTREADFVHGSNGIGDVELPPASRGPVDEHAMDLIIRLVKENPGEITLCPVGPMTNVALALAKAPEIAKLVKGIVIMGSTLFHPGIHGVKSPMVDANLHNDPEAARMVLRAGAPVTLVGMDVTMKTLLSSAMMREIEEKGDHAARTMMKITEFYVASYKQMHPANDGCPLHDPLAVAVCEDPSFVTTERMFADIELHGEITRGQTIPDRRPISRHLFNAEVAMDVDAPRFEKAFLETMLRV